MKTDEIIREIKLKTGLSEEEIYKKVVEKKEKFGSLLSLEGAAYLVAKELGMELLKPRKRSLELKNIVPGMKRIEVIARIVEIGEVKRFQRKDGSLGKVLSITLADASGSIKLTLWNEQTDIAKSLSVGDMIKLTNVISRENMFGDPELRLGYGRLEKVEDPNLPPLAELKKFLERKYEPISLDKLTSPGFYQIEAFAIKLQNSDPLFPVCPECGLGMKNGVCIEHGKQEPVKALRLRLTLDDGNGTIKAVVFKEIAEKLCGFKTSELENLEVEERINRIKEKILGMEGKFFGKVRRNRVSQKLEMVMLDFKPINTKAETQRLIEKIEKELNEGDRP